MHENLKTALTPTIVLLVAGGAFWAVYHENDLRIAVLLLLAALLASVVPFVCLLRGAAARRQKALFGHLDPLLAETAYAKIARQYFCRMVQKRLLSMPGFRLPVGFLTLLVFLSALAVFFGAGFTSLLKNANLFLGGIDVAAGSAGAGADATATDPVETFQRATLLMISMAALGAYVIVVVRLTKRINNYDMDPISFYFMSFHVIQAVVVAAVMRHLLVLIGLPVSTPLLAAVGFAIGLQPDLFLGFISGWVREKLGIATSPRQAEPEQDFRPTNLSLSMLEGMTKEKRARLAELEIDNCQMLAEYNPYLIWARTAFQLQQIVDWIAQAQLYILVKEDGLKKLRPYGLRDIFSFVVAAESAAKTKVADTVGIPEEVIEASIANLRAESSFTRLQEVRGVLMVAKAPRVPPASTESTPEVTPAQKAA